VLLKPFLFPQSGGCCVKVTGVRGFAIEDLCVILESPRKRGGLVRTVEPKHEDPIVEDSVLVTFEDESGEYMFSQYYGNILC